ncbi:MAG TPA: hypothetical protein VMJ10_18500 [Kofleriaceae bacterium]|nr:hypothetical protein [Kofleriaceae bacterium]
MRTVVFALITLAVACGDNIHPVVIVQTHVAGTTLAAGDPVGASCTIVDAHGEPVLDKHGNPIAETTDFAISYDAPELFSTDASGNVIAAKVGTGTVTCAAPSLALFDHDPPVVTIVAGPPVRVITDLATPTAVAGQADAVTCLAFDAFDNPVTDFTQTLALSPSGAGTTATATAVTATLIGEYTVSCVVTGAADVTPADLVVIPALPALLDGALDPERTLYAVLDQVTLIASAFDLYGNRVDDVTYHYAASPTLTSPGPARFLFSQDGTYDLSATVTSATQDGVPLSVSLPALVDSNGPTIDCMRIDSPTVAAEAYMVQQAPATVTVPVRISAAFDVQSVTIGGTPATFDGASGNYEASVPIGFGMSFVDVVATDQNNIQNSTTCFVLAASQFGPESTPLADAIALRLDQNAIGDPNPSGLNSLNDLFYTVMGSSALRTLVNNALVAANPISSGGCGIFACDPNVSYNNGSLAWDTPTTSLTLVAGGLQAHVTLPNVRLNVSACGTTCCIGGSNIEVTASSISATVNFSLTLQGGLVRTALAGTPQVSVGSVSLNGSGFCGFVVNLIQGFFTGTVKNAVQNALTNFINNQVGPLLDQLTSSLNISTLASSFSVPRLDGTGTITLGFGLDFSSLAIDTVHALIGIGTRFTPGSTAVSRPSLGIAERLPVAMLDPPGTTGSDPVGISAYEGLLNEMLHALWRAGYFQANLNLGGGTATIDSWLPPVAQINNNNTAVLMLGGVAATLTIPGIIDTPIQIMFGGNANATVSMNGNSLVFGNLALQQLYVSFDVTLSQSQRTAMESFLTTALQNVLGSALNNGLPAFPIPSFTLPASVSTYGLPGGARLGIVDPVLTTSNAHCVLDGQFGEQ